jgi:hypothetical protein
VRAHVSRQPGSWLTWDVRQKGKRMKLRHQHKMFTSLLCGSGFFAICGLIILFVFGESLARQVIGSVSVAAGIVLIIIAYLLEKRLGSAWRKLAKGGTDDIGGCGGI